MPQVLNIRHLPGFKERQPIIPPGAVYIGRANRWYRLPKSKWANPFTVRLETDRETAIASYERWLQSQPRLMAALPELRGLDLVCWCAPLPCHGDVLLRLPTAASRGARIASVQAARHGSAKLYLVARRPFSSSTGSRGREGAATRGRGQVTAA